MLLHDSAHSHAVQLNTMQWELLEQPAWSLGFTPHDCLIFGPLKKALKGHTFMPNDDVQETGAFVGQ